jgi:hypothetical protein
MFDRALRLRSDISREIMIHVRSPVILFLIPINYLKQSPVSVPPCSPTRRFAHKSPASPENCVKRANSIVYWLVLSTTNEREHSK